MHHWDHHLSDVTPENCPAEFLCTEDAVYDLLSSPDATKANGHDDILARMLKETALSITPLVTHLFKIYLSNLENCLTSGKPHASHLSHYFLFSVSFSKNTYVIF